MAELTASVLARAAKARNIDAEKYVGWLNAAMAHYKISNSRTRMAMFIAQVGVESRNLSDVEEDLYYKPETLMRVWSSRFPNLQSTVGFARNPEGLANKVYGGRMGNKQPGDGWKYRGRGLKQLTGASNYATAQEALRKVLGSRVDYVNNPDQVMEPEHAAWTAAWFWDSIGGNAIADSGNFELLTRKINGGLTGFSDRQILLATSQAVLNEAGVP